MGHPAGQQVSEARRVGILAFPPIRMMREWMGHPEFC